MTTDEKFLKSHKPLGPRGKHRRDVYRWVVLATWALLFVLALGAVVSLYWR